MTPTTKDPTEGSPADPQSDRSARRIDIVQSDFLTKLETHRSMLLRVCWAYTRSPHDRDDLYQEIAGRLWSAYPSYQPTRLFSTWMYLVAFNVAIDFRRRQSRRSMETIGIESAENVRVKDAPAKSDQIKELRERLERMPELDRAIAILVLEGNSYREISEILGISESNVGSRLHRLKDQLRRAVETNR